MDLMEPDGTHSILEMDTFPEVESFPHCMRMLELKKEHSAHSMPFGQQTILEHSAEKMLEHFVVEYRHSHAPTLDLLKPH